MNFSVNMDANKRQEYGDKKQAQEAATEAQVTMGARETPEARETMGAQEATEEQETPEARETMGTQESQEEQVTMGTQGATEVLKEKKNMKKNSSSGTTRKEQ